MITRYEIIASKGNRSYLIGYTPRVSRSGLLAVMQRHGPDIIRVIDIKEEDEIRWYTSPRVHAEVAGWFIGFTGRTQKEAQQAGEVEFIK